ncbi:hypothetical protein [Aromatoleum anaerobium]|uniref:Uncharacterized protein n=1 Tax=Aromatoleum anaerobium TaxID=182180 RepID=A0ABX1PRE5_9RHOO|nr:hypothetical protein [Aromatoleum anaerobium]MCK0508586.1 hypothetical protein [Aromatoleum anaerobium]
MPNFLPLKLPGRTSAYALSNEDLLGIVTDAMHGLSAKLDLFGGVGLAVGKINSMEYRARMIEVAEASTIYGQLQQVRDYAYEGLFPEFLFNFGDTLHDVMAFTYAQIRPFDYMDEFYGVPTGGDIQRLKILLTKFYARWKLDVPNEIEEKWDFVRLFAELMGLNGSLFTLTEIALLANMTERSVRNSARLSEPPSRRLTVKRDGHYLYVERGEAIRWLAGRRGFIRSTLPEGFPDSVFRSVYDKLGIDLNALEAAEDDDEILLRKDSVATQAQSKRNCFRGIGDEQ